jgi:hypothetical protein
MDQHEVQSILLPVVDRMIAPVAQRLDQMDQRQREDTQQLHTKLDGMLAVAQKIQTHENTMGDLKDRLSDLEQGQSNQQGELNQMKGRNQVVSWILGLIGAPVVVALVLAGIAKLFNIEVGGA